MFTTSNGIASLILKEIPYSSKAYIRIHQTVAVSALLEECISFCRAAGAEYVYATGHPVLEAYPLHTKIVTMTCRRNAIKDTDADALPLDQVGLSEFRDIYNEKMHKIPNAAYFTDRDASELLQRGGGYRIVRNGKLIGIGIVSEGKLEMLAAVEKGNGQHVLAALSALLPTESVGVEVATANSKAYDFYTRLGFCEEETISVWYKVF